MAAYVNVFTAIQQVELQGGKSDALFALKSAPTPPSGGLNF
jgi:hypothetical protein